MAAGLFAEVRDDARRLRPRLKGQRAVCVTRSDDVAAKKSLTSLLMKITQSDS